MRIKILLSTIFVYFLYSTVSFGQKTTDQESNIQQDKITDQLDEEQMQENFNQINGSEYFKSYNKENSTRLDLNSKDTSGKFMFNEIDHSKNIKNIDAFQPNQIYGMDFINNNKLDFSSENSLVPPPNYRIGPGDRIVVNLWGGSEQQEEYEVSRDGSIFPANLGKIYVQGLSFENLQRLLISRFNSIAASGTRIDVQLSKVRSIRINVIGEVKNPNSYTISSLSTAINAISLAGGLTDMGSLRDIKIKRNGRIIYTLDLYEFINNGGVVNSNIFLENNDYIIVPIHNKTVQAVGLFKKPMTFQLKEYEHLQKLIELTGGVKENARLGKVDIKRFSVENVELITFNLDTFIENPDLDLELFDNDMITIDTFKGNITNIVTINGAVKYPGQYELIEGETISNLIQKAGGLTGDVYKKRALLQRGDSINPSNTYAFNLENLENEDQELKFGDQITIYSRSTFSSPRTVQILGNVQSPGIYPLNGTMSLKDLILKAKGLTINAEYSRIEISSVLDTIQPLNKITLKPNQITYIDINQNLEHDYRLDSIKLKPFDIVSVKKNPFFKFQDIVTISGEVKYPGSYTLTEKSNKLSDIIERSGSLTSRSLINSAIFYRDSIGAMYVNFKKAINNPGSKHDILLQNGDKIEIPRNENVVTIEGEVISPINVYFDPETKTIQKYISYAGGFTTQAWKKNISIKYANGRTSRTKKILFLKFYPSIKSGATIIVPNQSGKNGLKLSSITNRINSSLQNTIQFVTASSTSILTIFVLLKSLNTL